MTRKWVDMGTEHDMIAPDTGANGASQPPDSHHALAGCPIQLTAESEVTEIKVTMKHGEVASEAGGFFCAPNWVFDLTDIDAHAKLTLLYLYRRADTDCRCFPSMGRASKDLGCSKPRVIESIRQLEAAGLVIVTRGKRADGGNAPNSYFLPIKPKKHVGGTVNALDRDGKPGCSGDGKPGLPEGHTILEGHIYNNTNASPTGSALDTEHPCNAGSQSAKSTREVSSACEKRHARRNPVPPWLCKACCDAWTAAYGGVLNFGRVRRALHPLMALYDADDIARGFAKYVAHTSQQYASPEAFVAKAGVWIKGHVGGLGVGEAANGAPDDIDDIDANADRAAREMRTLLGGG